MSEAINVFIDKVTDRQLFHSLELYQKLHGLTDLEKTEKIDTLWKESISRGCTNAFACKQFCITALLQEMDCDSETRKTPHSLVI